MKFWNRFKIAGILLGLMCSSLLSFAQRYCDLALTTLHPVDNAVIFADDTFYLSGSVKNLGNEAIVPSDIIKIQWKLNGTVIMFQGQFGSDSFLRYTNVAIAVNDSFIFSSPPIVGIPNGNSQSCMEVFLESAASDPSADTISSNNTDCVHFTYSQTASVAMQDKEPQLSFYPNPSSGYIHWEATRISKLHAIQVFNMQGQLVFSISSPMQTGRIDLTPFPSGMFLIKYETDTGIYHEKIER